MGARARLAAKQHQGASGSSEARESFMGVFQIQLEPSLDPLPGDSIRSFAPDPRQYID